eukprot:64788-Rhodomonas_salina.1
MMTGGSSVLIEQPEDKMITGLDRARVLVHLDSEPNTTLTYAPDALPLSYGQQVTLRTSRDRDPAAVWESKA